MKFADIPGHEIVKNKLRSLVDNNRVPHALLLEGPAGIGKYQLALALAQYIHCENRDTINGEPCGQCQACRLHNSFNHIDTHFVFPVVKAEKATSNPVSDEYISQWREFITQQPYVEFTRWTESFDKKNARPIIYVSESESLIHKLSFTTHISSHKLIIVWLPEKLNLEAANKLLKLIEEPFEDTIFIMVSNEPSEILPTIYSRLQRIEVKPLPDDVVADYLIERFSISETDAKAIAHIASGSMTEAMNLMEHTDESQRYLKIFIELMRLAYQRKVKELRNWAADLASLGREFEIKFYDYAVRLIRENFVLNFNLPEISYLNNEEKAFSANFARFITVSNVERLSEVFSEAIIDIAGNANGKIVNFDVAIKVILLLKQ